VCIFLHDKRKYLVSFWKDFIHFADCVGNSDTHSQVIHPHSFTCFLNSDLMRSESSCYVLDQMLVFFINIEKSVKTEAI